MQALKTFFYLLRAVALLLLGIFVLVNLYTMYMQIIFNVSYPTLFGLGKYIPSETYQSCNVSENDYLFTIDFGGYKRDDIVILEKTNGSMTIDKVSNNDGGNIYLISDTETPVNKSLLKGKVIFSIPGIGGLILVLESTVSIVIMVLLIVLIYELPKIIEGILSKRSIHKKIF